ncbi:membrane-associated protein, putative, partial [Bodo saltans]
MDTIRQLSYQELLFIFASVLMVISGYAGQILVMNLWLNNMGTIAPTQAPLSAISTTLFFGGALVFRIFMHWETISFRFMLNKRAVVLGVALGFCNAFSGIIMVYAAPNTPEIMQTLLLCTQVFWTLAGSKLFLKDERNLINVLVVASFLCVAGGIVVGALPTFSESSNSSSSSSSKWWTIIFCASMIPAALFNVFASMFMQEFTELPPTAILEDGSPLLINQAELVTDDHVRGDDATVKLTMLVLLSLGLVFWAFALLPLNATPWF